MIFFIQDSLLFVAKALSTPVEQIQFVFCMLLCFPLGSVYRTTLHPKRVSANTRLAMTILWGLFLGWICLGSEMIILILVCALCYGFTVSVNPKKVHKVVIVVSLIWLSVGQIARMILYYGINRFDYSGRLMIMFQKVTYLAFSLHDGLGRREVELSKDQKEQRIQRIPSLLEYFGYMFHHSTLLAGPVCTFNDFMDFIEGRDIASATDQETKKEPSPTNAVVTKLASSLLCLVLFCILSKIFPFHLTADSSFIANSSFLWRMAFAFLAMFTTRFKYYFAWIIADAVNNACGLGFNGYDPSGRERWNKMTNVYPVDLEISTNFKDLLNNWNITTNLWLKRIVYQRVSHHRTYFTLAVSAIWHGFYPGYLLALLVSILLIVADRKRSHVALRLFRHRSQDIPLINSLLQFLQWMACNPLCASYCLAAFVLLRFDLSMNFYRSTYFIGHILLIATLIICPSGKPRPSHDARGANGSVTPSGSFKFELNHKDDSLPSLANNNALHRKLK
ncbi:unnamed protein product [Pocillopora meandrina]|uniref:Uncharacterized protein n=1 Tax=Pocillopora meandrina TaxID=46732 RepID=A0AAU9XMA8_9CNID|nr:unnamed protein product [Pocillopora meandrina]